MVSPSEEVESLRQARADIESQVTRARERFDLLNARISDMQDEVDVLSRRANAEGTGWNDEALQQKDRDLHGLRIELERIEDGIYVLEQARTDNERQLESAKIQQLYEEFLQLAPLVEAQRESVGATGADDLSIAYTEEASRHSRGWRIWGAALLVAVALVTVGGYLLFDQDSVPDGKLTNGGVVEIVRNLVLVGLGLYLVRLAALQFRVHRHLEAVARNKAAALQTFNRMVNAGSEPEIRNSLATVLAQAVFASEETGFTDAGGDHITLIERVVAAVPRKP